MFGVIGRWIFHGHGMFHMTAEMMTGPNSNDTV